MSPFTHDCCLNLVICSIKQKYSSPNLTEDRALNEKKAPSWQGIIIVSGNQSIFADPRVIRHPHFVLGPRTKPT